MMDQKLKADWVKALRSGEYRQAQHKLRTVDDGYCCLGVLCSTLNAQWIEGRPMLNGELLDDDHEFLLSDHALKQVGLIRADQKQLSEMNDHGSSFGEIADYIEREIP